MIQNESWLEMVGLEPTGRTSLRCLPATCHPHFVKRADNGKSADNFLSVGWFETDKKEAAASPFRILTKHG
jgi:hypothetical protein